MKKIKESTTSIVQYMTPTTQQNFLRKQKLKNVKLLKKVFLYQTWLLVQHVL